MKNYLRTATLAFGLLTVAAPAALRFDGTNDYVTFGTASSLGVTNFTVECWFKRTGAGVITTTGTGGVTNAVPLVSKGRGEAESSNVDMNWFLGFTPDGVLAADFEDRNGGTNHPITGATAAASNIWQHAAVTYSQSSGTWVLYLNGQPDKTNVVAGADNVRTPRGDSIQHAGLGSAMNSTGVAAGFFGGVLDEVRVWNVARTQSEIATSKNLRITSAAGLIGRWPLTEASGTNAADTSGGSLNGSLRPSATNGPVWTADSAFPTAPVTGTLGNTNTGTFTDSIGSAGGAYINALRVQAGTNLTLVSMRAQVVGVTGRYKCAIYTDVGGLPGTLLGSTLEVTNPATGWQTFPLLANVTATNGQAYWLAIWSDAATAGMYYSGTNGTLRWGQYNYGVWPGSLTAPDGNNYNYSIYAVTAAAPATPTVTTTTLPAGIVGTAYNATLAANGGTAPYTWSLVNGTLPTGLALNTNNGAISGTPTAVGSFNFIAGVRDNVGATNVSGTLAIAVTAGSTASTNTLLSFNSVWRYQQTANLDGTGWQLPGYNDGAWPSGPGVLAEEDCNCLQPPILTTLTLFTNRLTHYFRTHFTFTGNAAEASLTFSNLIDNGAVLYLNGSEIQRIRMPAGPITDTTPSDVGVGDATNYDVFTLTGPALASLVTGDNVLAVEVHQANFTSSDVVFGLSLTAVTSGSPTNTGSGGLAFDGENDYVTFGAAPSLGLTNFTIECWFKQEGAGQKADTGSGGFHALPLVTRGMAENEAGNTNMNYFFGISTNNTGLPVLAADFEDFAGGTNRPVRGSGLVASNTWQHGAVTYEVASGTWKLYLNGVLDTTLALPHTGLALVPRFDSIQHAALGGSLRTGGTTNALSGFFAGTLDEVRIWNTARSSNEIAINFNREIKTNAPGLIARWALDDAAGLTATNSIGGAVAGALTNGPVWADGYPFSTPVNLPPATPVPNAPANNASNVITSPVLDVAVSDPDSSPLTVTYYGRVAGTAAPGEDFTFVALPDTQYYSSSLNGGLPAMFTNQTHWIITNRVNQNIQYVAQLGDCVQNGDNGGNNAEWLVATNAMYKLENPATTFLPEGVPYGIAVGNHDQGPTGNGDPADTTTFYNQFFGTNHFAGYNYYGDHFGANNDNHYDLFSAGGLDFIVVYFEYDATMTTNSPAITWAKNVLQTHANRRAIVVSHWIINAGFNATFGAQGQAIYDGLKGNTNLFLMLSGHVSPPEGQRTNTFQGRTVWSVMSDYQGRTAGGSGWLRYYEFSPSNNVIRARTYSPWLNQFETDADSQFEIPYQMSASNPFTSLGTNSNVPSGNNTSLVWSNLTPGVQYEWYATVSDGNSTVTSPVQTFTVATTPPTNAPPAISAITTQVINEDGSTGPLAFTIGDAETSAGSLGLSSTSSVPALVPPAGIVFGGSASNRTVTITPAANLSGTNLITLFVSDGTNTTSTAFELVVLPVNDEPVAVGDGLLRWMSQAVATPVATLLTNDTDIEGDLLTLLSVADATPPGATVTLSNNVVTYQAAFGDANPGAFNYIITDGNGGSATGAVAVAVQPDPAGVDTLGLARSGATLNLTLTGVPGFTYTVQTSPALVPPAWTNLAVAVADGLGQINITNAPTDPRRFFRTVRGSAP